MQQRNPKSGLSRARYEKYKKARTLREIKQLGGSWADIIWDFERGFIDFSGQRASLAFTCIEELEERKQHEKEIAELQYIHRRIGSDSNRQRIWCNFLSRKA